MAFTARPMSTNALYQGVNQTAHGFAIGTIVRFDGVDFVEASNGSEDNAAVIGIVSALNGSNSFYLSQEGYISGLTTIPAEGGNYIPGTLYYLSGTPGLLTAIKPTTDGTVELKCFVPFTETSGFFFNGGGTVIESPLAEQWFTVTTNTQMQVNSGYIINGAAPLEMTLPMNFQAGDTIFIVGAEGNGWIVKQNAGQSLLFNNLVTTVGVTGELQSDEDWNSVRLVGYTPDLKMQVLEPSGQPNVV